VSRRAHAAPARAIESLPKRDVLDRKFWSDLVPELNVSESLELGRVPRLPVDAAYAQVLTTRMRRDGFFAEPAALEAGAMARRHRGVETVRARFGHEVFALLYDEFWCTLAEVASLAGAVLGEGLRVVPLPYVNYVPPGDAGFGPHRDRNGDVLAPDGLPNMVTVWISLTDAGTERACLSVLPACCDPNFPDQLERLELRDLRDVRAIPVPAGSVICFNQALLHWGTRNSTDEPRVSFAFELERRGLADAREPSIDLESTLHFSERIGFVGAVVGMLSQSNVNFEQVDLEAAREMCSSVYGSRFEEFFR
jgi:hypothetical protein